MIAREIWIKSNDKNIKQEVVDTVISLTRQKKGDYTVTLYIEGEGLVYKLSRGANLLSKDSIPLLKEKFGEDNVLVREKEYPDPVKPTKVSARTETNILLKRIAEALERISYKMDYHEL